MVVYIDVTTRFVIYYFSTICNSWMKYLRCERSQLKLRSKITHIHIFMYSHLDAHTYGKRKRAAHTSLRKIHFKNFAHISIGTRLRSTSGSSNSNNVIIITVRHSPFMCRLHSQKNIPPDFTG